ncbi:sigma-70 family RNA polymerase sigma factor [Kitasatospora sp. NPDC093679]|uniref:sigma-70 family RNA polymerase sigma factor n=1 Tax=Kitasatospora sp. NPDC093679 TaxID=3154983 RepID=UPI003428B1E0
MFDHTGDPAERLPEQLFHLPRSAALPQASACPLPDRLPGEFLALFAARCEQFVQYAEPHLGTREHAVRVVDELFYELATCWDLALEQPSVDAYIWAVFKEILDDHLDARGGSSCFVDTAAFARVRQDARNTFELMEERIGLYSAIANLPERQFDAVVLTYVIGCTPRHTAWMMSVTTATVHSLRRDARRRLARTLGIDPDEIAAIGSEDQ